MSKLNKRSIGMGYRSLSVKGFTLIELLAVIVILAVIAIIVTPMIMGTIESSRANSYKTSAQNYVDAIDNAIAAKMAKGEETTNGTFTIVDLNKAYTIETNGKVPTSGSVTISNNKVSTYTFLEEGYAITGSKDGDTSISKVSGDKIYQDPVLNGADPVLDYGMIPVTIDNDGTVHKADITQEWYNYTNKEWANVVLVSSDIRDTYQKASNGTKLDQSKILAYLVWIPRYKYKLFNVSGVSMSPQSIEIVFENTSTTKSNGTQNGEYLTHPAFTFGNGELNGFWFGKFEMTGSKDNPTILPNSDSLRNLSASTFFNTIQSIKSDTYGITSDSHMVMNKEWGAVAYLTQSIYGKNAEVRINNNSNYTTGCGASTDNGSSNATCQIAYASNVADYPQSTTGNISGIFDISGGAWEYVMGTYNSTIGSSEFSSLPDSKYYQTYTDLASSPLGDSLKETQGWYSDYVGFVGSNYQWFIRGGGYNNGTYAGVFHFSYGSGSANSGRSARAVVASGE